MKSKDIVARVGPSQRAENMKRMLKGSTYTTFPPMMRSPGRDKVPLNFGFSLGYISKNGAFFQTSGHSGFDHTKLVSFKETHI